MVTVGGSHPETEQGLLGGQTEGSELPAHGIPMLISPWHLSPQSLQCRAPDPAPGGPVKVQSKASVKAPSLVGVICFLLNLSIFSRK